MLVELIDPNRLIRVWKDELLRLDRWHREKLFMDELNELRDEFYEKNVWREIRGRKNKKLRIA